jgi:putative ABC transport system ATP-binding protein
MRHFLNNNPHPLVQVIDLHKSYSAGEETIPVLQGVSFDIAAGEFVAIMGPSGNGKTTLLNMITGIDAPTSGQVFVNGVQLNRLTEDQLAAWRGVNLGIVFQFFQLLPALNLMQNVMLPMDFAKKLPRRQRKERALHLLEKVGLADQAHKLPSAVSGGQQQRAAIARALANDPPLIVADEPTGNLDAKTSGEVFELFAHLTEQGKTLVMVTHNPDLARQGSRLLEVVNGQIVRDEYLHNITHERVVDQNLV